MGKKEREAQRLIGLMFFIIAAFISWLIPGSGKWILTGAAVILFLTSQRELK